MKLFKTLETTFNNYDSTIHSYLSKIFSSLGLQYSHTQIFSIIFDGIKGIMQNIMVYIEDAFTEQNIETATRKKSIYSLAKQSGYEPVYGYAATGTVICKMIANTTNNSSSHKIYLHDKTLIRDITNANYYIMLLPTDNYVFDLTKPLITHEIKVVEGAFTTLNFTAQGKNLETFSVDGIGLWDRDYLNVYVDGIKYSQVTNLYDMTINGKEYILSVGYNNLFNIQFGNDIYGTKLTEGQNVTIEYIVHNGSRGNIQSNANYNFEFITPGEDGVGTNVDLNKFLTITMNNCISGGVDSDSIDFVKSMIGYSSRSLVLASADNFKMFLNRFSFISHINCWSEENSMTICVSALSNKYDELSEKGEYFSLNPNELLITDVQKELIQTALDNSHKTFAGVNLKFKDPVIRKFALMCYITTDSIYNRESIQTHVTNAIVDYFINLSTDSYFIPKSDIVVTALNSDSNIKSFDCTFISEVAEQSYYDGYYYTYKLKYANGTFDYSTRKIIYEKDSTPGIDMYGNISLGSKLEIPMLLGNFNYYTNKENNDKISTVLLKPIEFMFL